MSNLAVDATQLRRMEYTKTNPAAHEVGPSLAVHHKFDCPLCVTANLATPEEINISLFVVDIKSDVK